MAIDRVVHVIDDDIAVRDSLSFLLSTAGLAVRTHESASAFLERSAPGDGGGCIIADVRMPGISGIDLLARLREQGADIPVIVITGHGDVPLAVEAMKLGAADFLEKPFDDEALLAALDAACERQAKRDHQVGQAAKINQRLAALTARERQVFSGLVAGKANKIIAHDLGISPRTVEIYRANVMTKMKAASLSDLVRMAILLEIFADGSAG